MAAPTLYRLAEEILKPISGGDIQAATNIDIDEIKIAIGQAVNALLKTEHFSVNESMGEKIPNGSVIATYTGIAIQSTTVGKSKATLPVKPIKLPRNMGIWAVYLTNEPDKEFIPLQMGQSSLIKSQPLISGLMGQIGYENKGLELHFTKDLKQLFPNDTLTIEEVIMDISQYGDYDPLPILPEHELQIKKDIWALYSQVGVADLLVDSSNKQQQNIPVTQQKQTS